MSTHSSTNRGKRVRIKLNDGTVFVDKFLNTGSGWIEFEERGRIDKKLIKNFTIHKGETNGK